jgi:hypothetical protein
LIAQPPVPLQLLSCSLGNNSLQACYHVRHVTPLPQPARFPSDWQPQSGVTDLPELVSLPHLLQNPQERIALPPRSQQRPTPVTSARNKVLLPLPIPPLQFVTHRLRHSRAPSPANPRQSRVRHPELQKQRQTQNQSTSKPTTPVVSSAVAMRQSHPEKTKCHVARKGGPPAA